MNKILTLCHIIYHVKKVQFKNRDFQREKKSPSSLHFSCHICSINFFHYCLRFSLQNDSQEAILRVRGDKNFDSERYD